MNYLANNGYAHNPKVASSNLALATKLFLCFQQFPVLVATADGAGKGLDMTFRSEKLRGSSLYGARRSHQPPGALIQGCPVICVC